MLAAFTSMVFTPAPARTTREREDACANTCSSTSVLRTTRMEAWRAAVLRGDHGPISIGARTSVQDGCVAHTTENRSLTRIGTECTIGHRVVLHGSRVADRCLVGMGSVLLDNVEIGEWSFVGA